MSEYAGTPAAVLRQVIGERDDPPDVERFRAELPAREAAKRAFERAWGFADPRGFATERAYQRAEFGLRHRLHLTGALHIHVTEQEERDLVKRMRMAQEAERSMAASLAFQGPMSPEQVAAWAQEAQGPLRGVPKP